MKNWNEILYKAVNERSTFRIKENILNGADIHYNDDYVIKELSKCNSLDIIKYLFENYVFSKDTINKSLKYAVYNNQIEIVKYFIDNGADVNTLEYFLNHYAFEYVLYYDIITLLLENGLKTSKNYDCIYNKCYLNYLNFNRKLKLNKIYETNK